MGDEFKLPGWAVVLISVVVIAATFGFGYLVWFVREDSMKQVAKQKKELYFRCSTCPQDKQLVCGTERWDVYKVEKECK